MAAPARPLFRSSLIAALAFSFLLQPGAAAASLPGSSRS